MNTELIYLLTGLLTLFIGIIVGIYIQKLKTASNKSVWQEREQQLNRTVANLNERLVLESEEKRQLRSEKEKLGNQQVRYKADLENLQRVNTEQKKEVGRLQEKFTKEFENLANKILDEKSEKFTKQNKVNIENILTPLDKKIKEFEKKVEENQKQSFGINAALKEQLRLLQEQNLKITQEAENLTKALKGDSKMQGNWGELVLERVLEKSGLEKNREYNVQQSFERKDGSKAMPDVIINLPDGKKMVVDSKVSLTSYERFTNADEENKPKFLKDHINSLRKHVEQLSAKKYEDLYEMESPDFVLMFVPIEPAFAIAINEDNTIYPKAFEQNIVIVTPSTLLATLRTIDTMWSNEKQQKNALEIARQAGGLYDKFVGLISDLDNIGRSIKKSHELYAGSMKKLVDGDGNLIRRIERLKDMGAKAKKSIPEKYLKRSLEMENDNLEEEQPKLNS